MSVAYLLDTNHASPIYKNDPRTHDWGIRAAGADVMLCAPSVGELWHMVFGSERIAANEVVLRQLLKTMRTLPFGDREATEYGRVLVQLRSIGRPIPPIDIQIAAIAMVHDLTLLTADRHFDNVPNLRTENWLR